MGLRFSKKSKGSSSSGKTEVVAQPKHFKVILLGAGESGKSTFVKQLKVIYRIPMSDQDIQTYRLTLHNNTLTCMHVLVTQAEQRKLEFTTEEEECVKLIKSTFEEGSLKLLKPEEGHAIIKLWKSKTIRAVFEKRSEFWILDAAEYYFENCDRFLATDFVPEEEDCVMARVRTTGINETKIEEKDASFTIVDVAGQKSERKKWANAFEGVKAVIFFVALSGYHQVMFEDSNQNRMQEELKLFEAIANNPIFEDCPIFLYLNKKDLFEKMIQEVNLNTCFKDYNGSTNVNDAIDFVKAQFEKKVEKKQNLSTYVVAARFKKDVKLNWDECAQVMLGKKKK